MKYTKFIAIIAVLVILSAVIVSNQINASKPSNSNYAYSSYGSTAELSISCTCTPSIFEEVNK